jgi:hypothetical protein
MTPYELGMIQELRDIGMENEEHVYLLLRLLHETEISEVLSDTDREDLTYMYRVNQPQFK